MQLSLRRGCKSLPTSWGRPVAITTVTEGAALGAALLGAHASGQISSSAEIDAIVDRAAHVSRVLEPDATRAKQYDERFCSFIGISIPRRASCRTASSISKTPTAPETTSQDETHASETVQSPVNTASGGPQIRPPTES